MFPWAESATPIKRARQEHFASSDKLGDGVCHNGFTFATDAVIFVKRIDCINADFKGIFNRFSKRLGSSPSTSLFTHFNHWAWFSAFDKPPRLLIFQIARLIVISSRWWCRQVIII